MKSENSLSNLYNLVPVQTVQHLNQAIIQAIESGSNQSITRPALRLTMAGGKRLRGQLTLLVAASASAPQVSKSLHAATAIELLHLASLVHDDIIDAAETRRGEKTINNLEGNSHAILVGDFLIAVAFQQAALVSPDTVGILSKAFSKMCGGQAMENSQRFNLKRKETEYLDTVGKKSAELFAVSCQIGAVLGGYSKAESQELYNYGFNLGMAYQLLDDITDLAGPNGSDLDEGIFTLPIILAVETYGQSAVQQKLSDRPSLVPWLKQSGVLTNARRTVIKYVEQTKFSSTRPVSARLEALAEALFDDRISS